MRPRSWYRLRPALLVALVGVVGVAVWVRLGHKPTREEEMRRLAVELTALEAREQQVDEAVWAKELLAEQCGLVFDQWWDAVNAAPDKLAVLAELPVGTLTIPDWGAPERPGHGIEVRHPSTSGAAWATNDWRQVLATIRLAGWQLAQTEFRHNQFEVDDQERPRQSVVHFTANLVNATLNERANLDGDLRVDWVAERAPEGGPRVARIDARGLTLQTRRGEPAFRRVLFEEVAPPDKSFFIDPVILQDLDGDGLPEIILAARNLVFHRRADGAYDSAPLCRHDPGLIFTGVLADFDGDGAVDFLCAKFEGLELFRGTASGTFEQPGELVWQVNPHLKYGQVLTCGDVDGDGDLDVWLGQYKGPYTRGQMPTPYYDANDGDPAYLLLNDGHGRFADATGAAGLGAKRWRRSYSGSLVDLDGDGDLDLLVVSDFAGVDAYANDGHGHFHDMTASWLSQPKGFGMAHTLADFNGDGRFDLLVTGMHCPTALRLAHLGLARPERPDYAQMIPRMTAGNRLYLGTAGTNLVTHAQPSADRTRRSERDGRDSPAGSSPRFVCGLPMNASIAHSGWSWGCSAFDFDNDGFPDVAIATGHESRESVRDYEPEFWRHDIYVANSKDDVVRSAYFRGKYARTRGRGYSYGGYEKNRLYWNQQGAAFLEIGHLMGVAIEQDSRNAVTGDLDGDGRLDLVVTTFEVWPKERQTVQAYLNTLPSAGHWIGVRLRPSAGGPSPIGARVTLRQTSGTQTRDIVTGESHRAQHDTVAHFGLGPATAVESIEVRWPNGRVTTLPHPEVDRYHLAYSPGRK